MKTRVTIRPANAQDVEGIAVLCHQLGYPSSRGRVERRLLQVLQDEGHAVYVAEGPDGRVVGWVQVCARQLVVADLQAEIEGLVVDEGHRGGGIGRRLMAQAEQWARERGCQAVLLRSNIIREGAHAFYEGIGYEDIKTSKTFRKALFT
jgi:GNAT superfamily N-acetyltransferase